MIYLTRDIKEADGVFGTLHDEDNNILAVTLEHAYYFGGVCAAKIPEGTFVCVRGFHILPKMKYPFQTFEVTGVKDHSNLLFHMGNYTDDSSGCILLGKQIITLNSTRMITESRKTFSDFMSKMGRQEKFLLTVQSGVSK